MYDFFRENQKKVMALLGIVLMIAFIVPNRGMSGGGERLQGHIGKTKFTADQSRSAEDRLRALLQHVAIRRQQTAGAAEQWTPIVPMIAPGVAEQLQSHPEIYGLLVYEAREKMGLPLDLADADRILGDDNVAIAMPDGRKIPHQNVDDENLKDGIRFSLAELLTVANAFGQTGDAVKISRPLDTRQVIARFQQIKSQVVEFDAKDYESRIAPPIDAQLQSQFEKFADIDSTAVQSSATNPFALGYKFPNRVKVQYLSIPRAEVLRVVRGSKDDYAWEVEANKYYLSHPSDFPSTAPATTQQAHAPTTRPFNEVRQQIIDDLVNPQADKLQRQIQSEITAQLARDYDAYHRAQPTTGSASPTTSSAYESFDYLKSVAADIQRRFHVTLTVVSLTDVFRDAKELRTAPGIGLVSQFPDYATIAFEGFLPADQKSKPGVLSLFEPSKPITERSTNDVFIFRIADADPSHRPATPDQVKDQVRNDWARMQAYEMAKADAQRVLEAAKRNGIANAANGKPIISTGAYPMAVNYPITNYDLPPRAQPAFVRATYALLATLNQPGAGFPVTLVERPADGKIAVAQVTNVESALPAQLIDRARVETSTELRREFQTMMANNWFAYDSVAQRLGYVDETHARSTETD